MNNLPPFPKCLENRLPGMKRIDLSESKPNERTVAGHVVVFAKAPNEKLFGEDIKALVLVRNS